MGNDILKAVHELFGQTSYIPFLFDWTAEFTTFLRAGNQSTPGQNGVRDVWSAIISYAHPRQNPVSCLQSLDATPFKV